MVNSWVDRIHFRYHIKTKDGIIQQEISLRDYMYKHKNDILLGISFKEHEYINMENPDLIIK